MAVTLLSAKMRAEIKAQRPERDFRYYEPYQFELATGFTARLQGLEGPFAADEPEFPWANGW